MEGLIPVLLHAIKKQRQPAYAYRCLSENSTGRSYHRLLGEGSSEFGPPPTVDPFTDSEQLTSDINSIAGPGRAGFLASAGNGLKRRGFASGSKVMN